jgi:hypothetical protein
MGIEESGKADKSRKKGGESLLYFALGRRRCLFSFTFALFLFLTGKHEN